MGEKVTELTTRGSITGVEILYGASGGVDYQFNIDQIRDYFWFSPVLNGTPTAPTQNAGDNSTKLATTAYVDGALGTKANLASPTFTGNPVAPTQSAGNNSTRLATTAYLDRLLGAVSGIATLDGTGKIPTGQLPGGAVLTYLGTWDANANSPTIVSSTGSTGQYYIVGTSGSTTIDGNSTWVAGDWIVFGDGSKWQRVMGSGLLLSLSNFAPISAHTFLGNNSGSSASPSALTATQLTAELNVVVGDSGSGGTKGLVPAASAGAAASNSVLHADGTFHSFATLAASYAPLNSPTFTGTPAGPTQSANDNSTKLATTAYVDAAIAALSLGAPSGTVVFTILTSAPTGWLMFADQTIGDGSSGAGYANTNAQTVFTALFNNISDANCPIYTSTGTGTTRGAQGTAAAAWAAHCRIALPKSLGRALAVAGTGSGLSARALSVAVGEETHTLSSSEQSSMSVSGTGSGTASIGSATAGSSNVVGNINTGSGASTYIAGGNQPTPSTWNDLTVTVSSISGTASGGGAAHNNMQPSTFLNAMIKL